MRIVLPRLLFLALLATVSPAQASLITYNFSVQAVTGPLANTESTGYFSIDSRALPTSEVAVYDDGLISKLRFSWDGISYTEANVDNAALLFDEKGDLVFAAFGPGCSSGTCGLGGDGDNWVFNGNRLDRFEDNGISSFDYSTPLGLFEGNGTFIVGSNPKNPSQTLHQSFQTATFSAPVSPDLVNNTFIEEFETAYSTRQTLETSSFSLDPAVKQGLFEGAMELIKLGIEAALTGGLTMTIIIMPCGDPLGNYDYTCSQLFSSDLVMASLFDFRDYDIVFGVNSPNFATSDLMNTIGGSFMQNGLDGLVLASLSDVSSSLDQTFLRYNVRSIVDVTSVMAVPEPETYALMLMGLALLGFVIRRRNV